MPPPVQLPQPAAIKPVSEQRVHNPGHNPTHARHALLQLHRSMQQRPAPQRQHHELLPRVSHGEGGFLVAPGAQVSRWSIMHHIPWVSAPHMPRPEQGLPSGIGLDQLAPEDAAAANVVTAHLQVGSEYRAGLRACGQSYPLSCNFSSSI